MRPANSYEIFRYVDEWHLANEVANRSFFHAQIVQVSADGLRDGDMGNDESSYCAEEGLSVDILSCNAPPPSIPHQN